MYMLVMSWTQHQLNTRHANINLSCGFRFRFEPFLHASWGSCQLFKHRTGATTKPHRRSSTRPRRKFGFTADLCQTQTYNKPLIISYGQCIRVSVTLNKHRNPLGISTFLGLVELQLLLVVPSQSRFVLSVSLHTEFAPKALHVVCRETWHNV